MMSDLVKKIVELQQEVERLKTRDAHPYSNYSATAAPGVNDDADDGYQPGSLWIDTVNDNAYVCLDSKVGEAVWELASPSTILNSIIGFNLSSATELTIKVGAVTKTQANHTIDTESDAATDDLDTINGGAAADILFARPEDSARNVKVTENGNIFIPSGPDLYLDNTSDILGLLFDGTDWLNFANPFGRMSLIAEHELAAPDTDFTFADIPQTFRHLMMWQQLRTDRAAVSDLLYTQINADAGNNYDDIAIVGGTGGTSTSANAAGAWTFTGYTAGANSRANNFYPTITFIPNYTNTNFEKSGLTLSVSFADVATGNMRLIVDAIHWRSSNAIASITSLPGVGPNFVENCIFQLYGVL